MTDRPAHDATSETDKVRPFHAKDAASGQEAAEVVAAVLKHAAERDQAAKQRTAPKPQPKWMLPLGLNLGVLAVYLLIAPPAWVVVNPIAPPPDEAVRVNLRTGIYLNASKIEAFRARNGRLPATLAEAGISVANIDYTARADSTYELVSTLGEEPVVFDSSRDNLTEWGTDLDLSRRIGG